MESMQAELLTIGSELISGSTINTNAAYLARRLAECGIVCQRQVTVSDDRARLTQALQEALSRCDLLITTGGLGPTFDDLTMAVIADVTQRPLIRFPSVASRVRHFYARRHLPAGQAGRQLQRAALRQADLPEGGRPLSNPLGTAPGLWLQLPTMLLIALPGVPREMHAIMEQHVLPRLKRLGGMPIVETRTLRTAGVVELSIEAALRKLRIPNGVEIGLYPHLRMVDVRLTAATRSRPQAKRLLARLEAPLRRALGAHIYGVDDETIEEAVGRLMVAHHWRIAVAESCTGGLVADRLTNVPGSSRYVRGGVIAYHNDVKRTQLGVPSTLLARYGAVSAPVARSMAQGVRRLLGSDVGLAITGIAGPTGGTKRKPVGLVFLALADGCRVLSQRCRFFGDRLSIKAQAAQAALDFLRRSLQ